MHALPQWQWQDLALVVCIPRGCARLLGKHQPEQDVALPTFLKIGPQATTLLAAVRKQKAKAPQHSPMWR
jgi:hypothetical protein